MSRGRTSGLGDAAIVAQPERGTPGFPRPSPAHDISECCEYLGLRGPVRLALADEDAADDAPGVDEKDRRAGDVEGVEPEEVVDAVGLDDGARRVDEERKLEPVLLDELRDAVGRLAEDAYDLGAERAVLRESLLQLAELLTAVRSPRASEEVERERRAGKRREAHLLSRGALELERGCGVARLESVALAPHELFLLRAGGLSF